VLVGARAEASQRGRHVLVVSAYTLNECAYLVVVECRRAVRALAEVVGGRALGEHFVDLAGIQALVGVADTDERAALGTVDPAVTGALRARQRREFGADDGSPVVIGQRDAGPQGRLELRAGGLERARDLPRVLDASDLESPATLVNAEQNDAAVGVGHRDQALLEGLGERGSGAFGLDCLMVGAERAQVREQR
jgi:hypothetical protein